MVIRQRGQFVYRLSTRECIMSKRKRFRRAMARKAGWSIPIFPNISIIFTTSGHDILLISTISHQAETGGEAAGKAKEYTVNTIYYAKGNVHFITSGNVLFPFHLDRLARVSSFFRDLSDIPQPSGKEVGAPVSGQTILDKLNEPEDISTHTNSVIMFPECDAKGLQPWSNLVSLGGAHGLGLNISCEECDTLYTLMDKYGCDESLYECLRSQITFMAREKEWEMFIMASHGNDRILGKRALDKMDDKTFLEEGFSKRIRRLSDTWALAVYQALYTKDPNLSPETICPGSNEWTSGKWRTELSRAVDVAASDFINLYHWRKDLLATLFAKD